MANLQTRLITGLLVLLSIFFVPFASATTLESVQKQLASQSVIRGQFEQIRNMEMFKQPLTSTGVFLIAKGKGLLWKQAKPFPVTLVLTEDKLSQTFGDQPPKVMTSEDNPMAFYFSHLFLDLFQGNTAQLDGKFTRTFHAEQEAWTLQLVPNTAPLNKVFASIVISGKEHIDAIELTEVRGDITIIQFSEQTSQPLVLSSHEESAFQF